MEKQERNRLVYALDIGTRSIVGVVGESCDGKLKVLAVELAEHGSRTMIDGQIDNIRQVAELARTVTKRLEERLGVTLPQVSVAAAGRALQTQKGSFTIEFPAEQTIDEEAISRLEAGAVSRAEEALQAGAEDWKQMFLVGYTVSQYRLDNYPLTVLQEHKGRKAEVDVVATFLPGAVIESLYAAMRGAGLQVGSMTLEPIAAMNAAIPAELRLLNLALVDIGAGTTDIAICREGSVVGYTMTTIAGDEITEAIMRTFLVDFATAEAMKRSMREGENVTYRDILGLENSVGYEELLTAIQGPMERLADAVAKEIVNVNTGAPSAVFLAGGGSKLCGLREKVAAGLGMDERRVAIAGNNFEKSAFSETEDLENPEYTTPLGIAISAVLGLLNDSYVITLNGERAKLFRNGVLTVRDVLLMNGYTYQDMIGRTGRSLNLTLDGRRIILRGEPASPAVMTINSQEAPLSTVIHAGDQISFTPAGQGVDVKITLGDFLDQQLSLNGNISEETIGRVLVNNQPAALDVQLENQDVILLLDKAPMEREPEEAPELVPAVKPVPAAEPKPTQPEPVAAVPQSPAVKPVGAELEVMLNGEPLVLPPKEGGQPYYLMDLLQYSGIDFEHLDRSVRLVVNGVDSGFRRVIQRGDQVEIG